MWYLYRSKACIGWLCLALLLLGPCISSFGADWALSPSVSLSGEYNDNILFSRHHELDDFIIKLKPSVEMKAQTEQTQFKLDSVVVGEKYLQYDGLDTIKTNNNASILHYWTPRLSTNISANFIKDNVLETEIQRAGLTGVRKARYRYGINLSGTYALSDTISLTLGGGSNLSKYPNGPYPDLNLWQVTANPSWAITPQDTLGISSTYYDADYDGVGTIKTLTNSFYWRRDLSEKAYIVLGAGYRYTRTKYKVSSLSIIIDPATGEIYLVAVEKNRTARNHGIVFNFSLNNRWTERFSTKINAGREQYNSVDARSIELSYVRGTLSYRLTEKASANCALGYDNTKEEGESGEDSYYMRIAPNITYRYTENLKFILACSLEHKKNKATAYNYTRNRFRSWLTVAYQWPRLLANH